MCAGGYASPMKRAKHTPRPRSRLWWSSTTETRRFRNESLYRVSALRTRNRSRVKHYETRPRRTHIRGRVAVHAGRLDEVQATKHLTNGEFWAVLEAAGGGGNLPRGAVIGTVEIVDCVPVEELVDSLDNRERLLGDYSPGRFAWVLQNPVMFKTPIPAHGKQGWWNWEEPT